MDSPNPIMAVIIGGVSLAILWVIVWALLVPNFTPSLSWSGYDGKDVMTIVFLVGCAFGGWSWFTSRR